MPPENPDIFRYFLVLKLTPSHMVRYFECKALPLWTLPHDVIVHVKALHSIWMLSVYSFKAISNHADWFFHWISTFESLTPQLLWAKKRNFPNSQKLNLGIVRSRIQYIKFPISAFSQFIRIWRFQGGNFLNLHTVVCVCVTPVSFL